MRFRNFEIGHYRKKSEYEYFIKIQKERCAICGVHQSNVPKKFAVDHIHGTSIIRGLLCSPCNLGLGCFDDNPQFLDYAKQYLESRGCKYTV